MQQREVRPLPGVADLVGDDRLLQEVESGVSSPVVAVEVVREGRAEGEAEGVDGVVRRRLLMDEAVVRPAAGVTHPFGRLAPTRPVCAVVDRADRVEAEVSLERRELGEHVLPAEGARVAEAVPKVVVQRQLVAVRLDRRGVRHREPEHPVARHRVDVIGEARSWRKSDATRWRPLLAASSSPPQKQTRSGTAPSWAAAARSTAGRCAPGRSDQPDQFVGVLDMLRNLRRWRRDRSPAGSRRRRDRP